VDNTIIMFLVFGAVFGFATYSRRHLFGEGPSKPKNADPVGGLQGRAYWVSMSTLLWPVLVLAGVYGAYRRRLVQRR